MTWVFSTPQYRSKTYSFPQTIIMNLKVIHSSTQTKHFLSTVVFPRMISKKATTQPRLLKTSSRKLRCVKTRESKKQQKGNHSNEKNHHNKTLSESISNLILWFKKKITFQSSLRILIKLKKGWTFCRWLDRLQRWVRGNYRRKKSKGKTVRRKTRG